MSLGVIRGSVSRDGAWGSDCVSSQRGGRHFAQVYSFVLDSAADVTIELTSSIDTVLYLLDSVNREIESDDDDGTAHNSRIVRRLDAGMYFVKATTFSAGARGSFTVRVDTASAQSPTSPPPTSPDHGCDVVELGVIRESVTVDGTWDSDCVSTQMGDQHFARLYSFEPDWHRDVTIELTSSIERTQLYLFRKRSFVAPVGEDTQTWVLIHADSYGAPDGDDVSVTSGIDPYATYFIEVTTVDPGVRGSFTLRVEAYIPPAPLGADGAEQQQTSWYVNDKPTLYGPPEKWFQGTAGHGYGSNNFHYMHGRDIPREEVENWAHWHMGARVGIQEVQVYIPASDATATVDYEFYNNARNDKIISKNGQYDQLLGWVMAVGDPFEQDEVSGGWYTIGHAPIPTAGRTLDIVVAARRPIRLDEYDSADAAMSRIAVDAIRMRCVSECSRR